MSAFKFTTNDLALCRAIAAMKRRFEPTKMKSGEDIKRAKFVRFAINELMNEFQRQKRMIEGEVEP